MVAAPVVNWEALATEARSVGMKQADFMALNGNVEAIRAAIAVARAWGTPAETTATDADGDTVASQTSSNAPKGTDDEIPF